MKTLEGGLNARLLPTWKRIMDVGFCLAALPALLIATAAAVLVTKVVSPGPILFRQERVGYRGRRFFLYKFRTMRARSDTAVHQEYLARLLKSNAPMQKLDTHDERLIPGAWLWRASGLDELPQIINVLRGEMSLVGPRPCIPYEYDQYTPDQRTRLDSVPGLTGLWQVSGKNRTTFERMVELDIEYAQQRSLIFDLRIILKTLPALWVQVSDTREARQLDRRPLRGGLFNLSGGGRAKPASLPRFANTAT